MSKYTIAKALTAATVFGALLGGTIAAAGTASAAATDSRPCVTRGEYRAVHAGMTRAQVVKLFDSRGKENTDEVWSDKYGTWHSHGRFWKGCPGVHGTIDVDFDNWSHSGRTDEWGDVMPGSALRVTGKDHSSWWTGW